MIEPLSLWNKTPTRQAQPATAGCACGARTLFVQAYRSPPSARCW